MTIPWLRDRSLLEGVSRRSRIFILIMDGAADDASALARTPLSSATTPAMDSLAKRATHGFVKVIPGIVPESDCGCMAWLGFDPHVYYTGRGPLEGLGCGFIKPGMNSVCFRCNFANWNPATNQLERRTARGLTQSELDQLVADIKANVKLDSSAISFDLMAFGGYRGVLAFYSHKNRLSGNVSNTDPLFVKTGPFGQQAASNSPFPLRCTSLDAKPESIETAALVNKFVERAAEALQHCSVNQRRKAGGQLSANFIILRDGGDAPPKMPSYQERFGLSVAFFGQIPAERALMNLLGGSYSDARSNDGEPPAAFYHRIKCRVIESKADVVMVHFVKGADEGGHDKDFGAKQEAIELFDRFFLKDFLEWVSPADYVVITSDHATPCATGMHSSDPVPVMVSGPLVEPDGISKFSELTSKMGRLKLSSACEFVPLLRGII